MAKAKNMVIAGDYQGKAVMSGAKPAIVVKIFRPLYLDSTTVESYEVITDEHRKSAEVRCLDRSAWWQVVYLQRIRGFIRLQFSSRTVKNR